MISLDWMRNRPVNRSMNGSIDRAVDRSIKPIIYDQPIDRYQRIHWSVSRFIDEPFTRWIEYRWIDRSTNRGIQCYINNQPPNQRPIDRSSERSIHRSIDQSSDRSIYQSIKRSFSNSSNRPDARTEIQRRAVREGTSKISKTENQKKIYTPRRARAAGACLPLYCKYSAPRARLVYLLWTKGNCYSMTSRIRKRSFGKFLTYQCNYAALRIFTPKSDNLRDARRCCDSAQTNSKSFSSASKWLRTDSKTSPKYFPALVFNFSRKK